VKKILVIGCSGVGKSTFAVQIAEKTDLPFTLTDPFYWKPNWQLASIETVIELVDAATQQETWVLDGNFDDWRGIVWQRADMVIWLDYPLWRILFQVCTRNFGLWATQKPTWSDNRMTWNGAWTGVRHAWRSHKLKLAKYPGYLAEFPGVQQLRFKHPREASKWLSTR
jgi:adenylate kinase family enzyme